MKMLSLNKETITCLDNWNGFVGICNLAWSRQSMLNLIDRATQRACPTSLRDAQMRLAIDISFRLLSLYSRLH